MGGMPPARFAITIALLAALYLNTCLQAASPANTGPLNPIPDRSASLLQGAHQLLDRIEQLSINARAAHWKTDTSSPINAAASFAKKRELLQTILGIRGDRIAADLDLSPNPSSSREAHPIRWTALESLHGDGIRIPPTKQSAAPVSIILLPDIRLSPEQRVKQGTPELSLPLNTDAEILIPRLLNRDTQFSGNPSLGIQTNCSHREWIYRQSFILGLHPLGLEIQKILSLIDSLAKREPAPDILLVGEGEAAWIALFAAAIDTRIRSVMLSGHFGPREKLAEEPLDHNLFGMLKTFGDAELAAMIAPRSLIIRHSAPLPHAPEPPKKDVRQVAAPGHIVVPSLEQFRSETARIETLTKTVYPSWRPTVIETAAQPVPLERLSQKLRSSSQTPTLQKDPSPTVIANRQGTTVRDMEDYCQKQIIVTERNRTMATRQQYPSDNLERFQEGLEKRRADFWTHAIGRFDEPFLPLQARSRPLHETSAVSLFEVEIDVWKDLPAWGWLCLPKDLKPSERRPVVVCQHGLEGLPEHLFDTDESSTAWRAYKAFALRLAERGFITFAPHNLYRGKDVFRSLQRRLNPLGLSLYSLINGQHQRILEWLSTQPFVDPERIGFYGLSYGGKSAMRTPGSLPGYCLSICSGDFNEWIRKCASTSMPMSYVYVAEHEIWEWNLANHANYAEMAALIAPRPFMVERGHRDGVGLDEWVDYEFAKVRRLYNQLGIGHLTAIEHFDGPHTINGQGTFDFLHTHLRFPAPTRPSK
jgi:hypothetical protein